MSHLVFPAKILYFEYFEYCSKMEKNWQKCTMILLVGYFQTMCEVVALINLGATITSPRLGDFI